MQYRAQVRLDFDGQNSNEYQKLVAAFLQLGWSYVQTSSVAVETLDIDIVLRGMELLAKQLPAAGTLTGLLFDVQGSENFDGIPYVAAGNHPNALADIRSRPLP